MPVRKILCVCHGNTCRSPMFVGLLLQVLAEQGKRNIEVESAGMLRETAGMPANPHAIEAMRDRGIDITAHQARWIGTLDLAAYDRLLCVEPEQVDVLGSLGAPRERIEVLNEANGGIPNPYGKDLETYKTCSTIIRLAALAVANTL